MEEFHFDIYEVISGQPEVLRQLRNWSETKTRTRAFTRRYETNRVRFQIRLEYCNIVETVKCVSVKVCPT